MVVNCVTAAGKRGEMLARLAGHLKRPSAGSVMPDGGGIGRSGSGSSSSSSSSSNTPTPTASPPPSLLLLALPSRCLSSPHVGRARFLMLLGAMGLVLLAERETPKVRGFE